VRPLFLLSVAVAVLAWAGSANAAQFTFGTTTVGTSNNPLDKDSKAVNLMSSPKAGTVVNVQGYLDGLGSSSGSQKIKVVVYALSGGVPGALLGASNEVTIQHGQAAGWVTFTFPGSVSIPAGEVAFGYHRGGPTTRLIRAWFDAAGGTRKSNSDSYSNGPSNPFGTVTSTVTPAFALKVTADDGVSSTIYDQPEPRYGISPGFNALSRSSSMELFELDQVKRVGSKLFRIDYLDTSNPWHAHAVEVIGEAQSNGQEPELVIGGTMTPTSRTVTQYGGDCSEAATSYHNQIRYYEVMNEPNSNGWTAAAYEPYLAACFNAIKAVDSRNIVLLGGLNPATTGTQSITWMSDLYAAGAKPYFDRMNIHLYGDPTVVADWSSWCKTYGCGGVVSPSIKDVMTSNGDGSKLIVSTEGGDAVSVGEATQATTVSRYLADARPFQEYVYNMLADTPDFGLMVQDASGTIVAPDGTHWRRRPSYESARVAMGGTG
jgi:Cellulase (glycosyl hydrolase family 5)